MKRSLLSKILKRKHDEIGRLYRERMDDTDMLPEYAPAQRRDFRKALLQEGRNIIAEFKRASPFRGMIRENACPETLCRLYEKSGAAALSVLTDSGFDGNMKDLRRARQATHIPILRKDFIIDKVQIYESRFYGADAVLLIASLLEPSQLKDYQEIAASLSMESLVEIHTKSDLEKALKTDAEIIGINSRNLSDFSVDVKRIGQYLKYIPSDKIIVAESGIHSSADMNYLHEVSKGRINGFLIGEYLMSKEKNPSLTHIKKKLKELLSAEK